MNFEFLIGPLMGGVIGYITNGIAIKMLFRPLKPLYIFGKRVPFTPGLIPKERDRIAHSVGQVVGNELINQETLRQNLLSQEMYAKVERSINEWFLAKKNSKTTVREFLYSLESKEGIDALTSDVKDKVTQVGYQKLVNLELGSMLAENACHEIKGNLGALAMFLNDSLMETARIKIEFIINEMIKDKAEELIRNLLDEEGENLLEQQVNEIIANLEEHLPKIKYVLLKQYTHIIENQLNQMLTSIDIPNMVEEKIKQYDMLELEKMILEIMSKELKAIIWLGALLGAIMGTLISIF